MIETFTKQFTAGWGDMDFNAHMRNTAYLDYAGTVRMMYFDENGFSAAEFRKQMFGPVIFKDELTYFKETHLLDSFSVDIRLDGISADGSRFRIRNEFAKKDGKTALVLSTGAWLNLKERKLGPPPQALIEVIAKLPRTQDFKTIERSS